MVMNRNFKNIHITEMKLAHFQNILSKDFRTLSKTEQGYAQIEKEGLAIVFGIKKFHNFIYGRSFVLCTDHRPLTKIFGEKSNMAFSKH